MKWSLETSHARQAKNLKETKHSLVLHWNQTLLGDKSYRYNIKHVQHTNSTVYCKQKIQNYAHL